MDRTKVSGKQRRSKDVQGRPRFLLPEVPAARVRLFMVELPGSMLDTLRVETGLDLKTGD